MQHASIKKKNVGDWETGRPMVKICRKETDATHYISSSRLVVGIPIEFWSIHAKGHGLPAHS